jgi:hypothetical protein
MAGFHSFDDDFLYEDQCEIFESTPEEESPLKRSAAIITKWHNRIDSIMEQRAEFRRVQDREWAEQQAEIKRIQEADQSNRRVLSVLSDRWVQLGR